MRDVVWDEGAYRLPNAPCACTHRTLKVRGIKEMLERLFSRARGQGLVEYALIIALVAIVVIGTLILLGPQIASIFKNISNNL
jgi:pilus assembly protein Flp/PilA